MKEDKVIKKVAIYTRVSTREQVTEGYSIAEQENKLKHFADFSDWEVYNVYTDAGFTGANTKRPQLKKMMNELDQFDMILVYKLDRLTRNVRDLLTLLDTLEEHNVSFRSATEVYDTSSAMGRLFVTLVGAMAEWERTTISERTLMGRRARAKMGVSINKIPFFLDKVDGKLEVNENKDVVRFMVDELMSGKSVNNVVDQLNNSDYQPPGNRTRGNGENKRWYNSSVRDVINNIHTRGHTKYDDILIKNTHEAIITDEEYEQITHRVQGRLNLKTTRHLAVFRKRIECPVCGATLSVNTTKNKKLDKVDVYYMCKDCKQEKRPSLTFSEKTMLKAFYEAISKFDWDDYEINGGEKKQESRIDIDKVMKQRKKYHELYAMDMMEKEELAQFMRESDKLIKEYENSRKDIRHDTEKYEHVQNALMDGWERSTNLEKAEMVNMLVERIYIDFESIKGKKNKVEVKNIIWM